MVNNSSERRSIRDIIKNLPDELDVIAIRIFTGLSDNAARRHVVAMNKNRADMHNKIEEHYQKTPVSEKTQEKTE